MHLTYPLVPQCSERDEIWRSTMQRGCKRNALICQRISGTSTSNNRMTSVVSETAPRRSKARMSAGLEEAVVDRKADCGGLKQALECFLCARDHDD